jgi:hypothetical protein
MFSTSGLPPIHSSLALPYPVRLNADVAPELSPQLARRFQRRRLQSLELQTGSTPSSVQFRDRLRPAPVSPLNSFARRTRLCLVKASNNQVCRVRQHQEQLSFTSGASFEVQEVWRRGWDLNPRYPLRYVRFRGGSFQPLTHLSGKQLPVVRCQSEPDSSLRAEWQ